MDVCFHSSLCLCDKDNFTVATMVKLVVVGSFTPGFIALWPKGRIFISPPTTLHTEREARRVIRSHLRPSGIPWPIALISFTVISVLTATPSIVMCDQRVAASMVTMDLICTSALGYMAVWPKRNRRWLPIYA